MEQMTKILMELATGVVSLIGSSSKIAAKPQRELQIVKKFGMLLINLVCLSKTEEVFFIISHCVKIIISGLSNRMKTTV